MSTAKCASKAAIVLVVTGLAFGAGEARKDLHFKVGKHPMVSINNPYGPVIIKAGAPREVVVTVILHSDKVELDQSQGRNRIDIVSHLLPGADQNTGIVEYEVQVPEEANLTVRSDNGRIHAEKLHGDVTMEGSSGAMEVLDCGDGHVHVKTLNGPVTITNVRNGHVEVVSMGGDVLLTSVTGPYVSVNSNTGRIQYAGDFGDEGEYEFTSHTGDIEAVAPAYASIDVLARSNQGRVDSDFSLEPRHTPFLALPGSAYHGTLGKAASSVKLFSFSGRIHLKRRQ
jgi:putative adhesin